MKFAILALSVCAWSQQLLRVDHYVKVKSVAPSMNGQTAQIYVREVVLDGAGLRGDDRPDRVVLFVHGAGTPAEVAFDAQYKDYSWMAYLAKAGYDVFSMDMEGYGRSTRPAVMNDPCNLTREQQLSLFGKDCAPSYTERVTTADSDWHDIDGVVEHLRKIRGVSKVSLIGWSQGGPRSGGYASQHPASISKLILLAPAYSLAASAGGAPRTGGPIFNTQSRADLDANWDRQIGCPDQVDPAARESVWRDMLASDPVGATWGTGVRRAPNATSRGWNKEVVSKMRIPALFVAPALDKQALPANVRQLHADYGAPAKILLDLGCASHNALWERNHLLLFQASLTFLNDGTVGGKKDGVVSLGY
ncbi:MAG: alpha/beta hydrolase [Acidobacteria bacterium]|nr:alpha/beta hydrolase [Acidobacteriota bacterium]